MIASVTDGCDNGQPAPTKHPKNRRRCLSASFTMSSLPYPRERVLKAVTKEK